MSKNLKLISLALSVLFVGAFILAFSPARIIVDPPESQDASQAALIPKIQLNSAQASESAELTTLLTGLNAAVAKIGKDIQSSNGRIEKLENSLKSLATKTDQEPAHKEEQATDAVPPEDQLQRRRERAYEQTRTFDEALVAEKRDESWASQMENTITTATEGKAYSGSTFGVPKCGATFCRVEAYHSDPASQESFENIRRDFPNSYHIQHFEDAPGQLRSVMYVVREGEEQNTVLFKTLAGG